MCNQYFNIEMLHSFNLCNLVCILYLQHISICTCHFQVFSRHVWLTIIFLSFVPSLFFLQSHFFLYFKFRSFSSICLGCVLKISVGNYTTTYILSQENLPFILYLFCLHLCLFLLLEFLLLTCYFFCLVLHPCAPNFIFFPFCFFLFVLRSLFHLVFQATVLCLLLILYSKF